MSKFVLHIIFISTLFFARGQQNLVPNGSFEENNWCPSTTDGYNINASKYWTSPTTGTPDYFNGCSTEYDLGLQTYKFSVPENYYGFQYAQDGIAYGAFVFTQNEVGSQTYSEYVQIGLTEPLKDGRLYEVSFFINNPKAQFCVNSVGALFTASQLNLNHDQVISMTPQVSSDPGVFFCDTLLWQQVKGTFIATGGESYLTIGIFKQLPDLLVSDYYGNPIPDFPSVYLYIDDVSVKERGLEIPNIFTPNNDGINDFFEFNTFPINSLEIFNRWGNTLFVGGPNSRWNGDQATDGIYFYKVSYDCENETHTKTGFVQLIR